MGKYELGSIIRDCRKQKNISQADLCRGICSMSNLSRMENGEFEAPMIMTQTILERLGVGLDGFEMLLEHGDCKLYQQRRKIEQALLEEQAALAEAMVGNYEKEMRKDKLNIQYLKYCKAEIGWMKMQDSFQEQTWKENLLNGIEQLLREAAKLTILEGGRDLLLSRTEMGILLAAPRGLSIKKLKYIQHFAKAFYSKEWMGRYYPRIQLKYAGILTEQGKYRKALAEIEEGLAVIKEGKSYRYCADLYFLSVQIYRRMGWENLSEKEQMDMGRRCRQAYCLYAIDKSPRAKDVQKYMEQSHIRG